MCTSAATNTTGHPLRQIKIPWQWVFVRGTAMVEFHIHGRLEKNGLGWAWQYQCQTMKRLKTAAWLGWGRIGLAGVSAGVRGWGGGGGLPPPAQAHSPLASVLALHNVPRARALLSPEDQALGIQLVSRDRGGARLFFCCGCAARLFFAVGAPLNAFVRCGLAIAWFCASAAGAGLGNPIGHGLRRGLCGAGGARLFFCCGCAARFCFCCGCALARGWAGQEESNGAWAGQPRGGAFIFLLRVRGAFFFAVGAQQVRSLTCCRPPPSIHVLQKGIQGPWRVFFFCCGCASSGGARLFFCCGCAARLFLLWVRGKFTHSLAAGRPSIHVLQKDIQGPWRVYFFAAGARAHSLTRCPAARRAPTAKKHTQQKKTRVPGLGL